MAHSLRYTPQCDDKLILTPFTGEFEFLTGVKDAAHLLEGPPIDVDALPEGTLFDRGPVFQIEGQYLDLAR
jgi:nicotinate phosphoribosyltransferase